MVGSILLVDDEPSLRASLSYSLTRSGFRVHTAPDGPAALRAVQDQRPDLVLLDVMLPGLDGIEVCRRLRAHTDVPIVMLSARGDPTDQVVGLEAGADDYVAKPFGLAELVARLRAHLRRRAIADTVRSTPTGSGERLTVNDLVLDLTARRAWVNGRELALRRRELDLLAFMARNAGIVLSRAKLLESVWEDELVADSRTVDVHIQRLRRNLGEATYLRTVRGLGYVLRRA